MRYFVLCGLLCVFGCSERERGGTPGSDAAAADAGRFDGGVTDAGGGSDASRDAEAPVDAAVASDAGSADAGQDASTSTCGDLGKPCTSAGECGSGLECHGSGVCLPEETPDCGGFAGAVCPPTAPECMYCSGCSFGPCLTSAERACVCAQPGARTRFSEC